MNAVEFIFAVIAVSSATAVIYAWNRFVYGLDDKYGTYAKIEGKIKSESEHAHTK